jgi:hypothetical protein
MSSGEEILHTFSDPLVSIYINLDLVEPTVFKEDDNAPLTDNEGVARPYKVGRGL